MPKTLKNTCFYVLPLLFAFFCNIQNSKKKPMLSILPPSNFTPKITKITPISIDFHQEIVFLQFAHMVHCVQGVVGTCRLFPSNLMWLFWSTSFQICVHKTAKNAKKTHVFTYFGRFYVVFFSVFNDFQRVFNCGPVPAFHGPGKTLNSFFFLKFFFKEYPPCSTKFDRPDRVKCANDKIRNQLKPDKAQQDCWAWSGLK